MNIVYARESLADCLAAGVERLLEEHWQEIAHHRDIPLEVDWAAYGLAEQAGKLRIYTARAEGRLVGYGAYLVQRNPHYASSLQAVQDVLYLAPAYRKGRVGYKLVAYADQELAREGVQCVYQHSKLAKDFGAILERQGYELVDLLYCKRLDRG